MKLELLPKLAQQQILSPKMLLSMKMLPLTNAELELQISKELAENPALEIAREPAQTPQPASRPDVVATSLRVFEPFQDSAARPRRQSGNNDDFFDTCDLCRNSGHYHSRRQRR